MDFGGILQEFLSDEIGIVSRMVDNGYALIPAKSAGYEKGKHEAEYYIDQSMRTHVLNGLFAITRLLSYLDAHQFYNISEEDFKRVLALFATHDLHKSPKVEKGNRGEFDISLIEIAEEVTALGIHNFVQTSPTEHRLAMIHLASPRFSDLSSAPPDTSKLVTIVRLADSLASMPTVREYKGAENYLSKLSRSLVGGKCCFYYHELDDYRGLSTLLVHQATSVVLENKYELFPLLYFANGVLYVGSGEIEFADADELREEIAQAFFNTIRGSLEYKAQTLAAEALIHAQSIKFGKYIYLFADTGHLLEALEADATRSRERNFATDAVKRRVNKGRYSEVSEFFKLYQISPDAEKDADFTEKWQAVYRFVMGTENLARAFVGEEKSIDWLMVHLNTPKDVADTIKGRLKDLRSGGVSDHAIIIAYHYLVNHQFGADQRSARVAEISQILEKMRTEIANAIEPYDTLEKRLSFVNEEFAIESDIHVYLKSNLIFSFDQQREITTPLEIYRQSRTRTHGRLCAFCNREIPKEMKEKKITLAEEVMTTFSNRIIPRREKVNLMVWCPMCWLEFMLRKVTNIGYAKGADVNSSDRLYLYLLPDYSFTPDFWKYAGKTLKEFRSATNLKLRQYGAEDEMSLPRKWMEEGKVDSELLAHAAYLFEREAERLGEIVEKTGKPRSESPGERIVVPPLRESNYLFLPYEKSVSQRFKRLAPTRSELWAKAAYAAIWLHLLLGVRVYVTDKPYLPLTSPTELKTIIHLDAPHVLVRNALPEGNLISLANLQASLNILSAAWEANNVLATGTGNLDKQIAEILERINVEPLAGAGFYKERERDDRAIYRAFAKACDVLLQYNDERERSKLTQGGTKMDLAQKLTNGSLDLFLPSRPRRRLGKAHRYETVFRTAVEVIKKNPKLEESELISRIAGSLEKHVPRIEGGGVPLYGEQFTQAAENFAQIVVNELFVGRCQRSSARLTHEENALADAIYHLTEKQLNQRWVDYKKKFSDADET